MISSRAAFVVLSLAALGTSGIARAATAPVGGAAVGKPAPAFVVAKPGGGQYSRASFAGRPMVLNVYASWCASCRREEGALVAARRRYGARVSFLGVDEQEGETIAVRFAHAMGVTYPVAIDDGQFSATYRTTKIPETVFVDRAGVVRAIHLGRMSSADLEAAIATILPRTGGDT